jgi:hypothetical protein
MVLVCVTDKLESNIINSTIQRDKKEELMNKTLEKDIYRHKMLKAIKKCGVTFKRWQKSDENGYISHEVDLA